MFILGKAFSSFSVNDLGVAARFYTEVLGLAAEELPEGLQLKISGSIPIFLYQKDDHAPASFTALNFPVDNIDQAVSELKSKGVTFEQYPEMTDNDGIARGRAHNMGPDIAWFRDPAGNILSVLQS